MASQLFSPGTVVTSTWLNEADTSTHPQLSSIGGTADAITATGPASLLAYTTGQTFCFIPAVNNTNLATININGLGAKVLGKYGNVGLASGDLVAGMVAEIVYDGVAFQLTNPRTVSATGLTGTVPISSGGTGATTASQALINLGATGRLIGVQTFISSGTYIPTTGTTAVLVEAVGAGGGGGNSAVTGAGQVSAGGGGGPGAYLKSYFTSGFSPSVSVTIAAGAPNNTAGGDSSFGALMTIKGGMAGGVGAAGAVSVGAGAVSVSGSTGGNIISTSTNSSSSGWGSNAAGIVISGKGADSPWGTGGFSASATLVQNVAGNSAGGRGAGGSGAASGNSVGSGAAGGAGSGAMIVVYEYS